jgi:hypothetical protein
MDDLNSRPYWVTAYWAMPAQYSEPLQSVSETERIFTDGILPRSIQLLAPL